MFCTEKNEFVDQLKMLRKTETSISSNDLCFLALFR